MRDPSFQRKLTRSAFLVPLFVATAFAAPPTAPKKAPPKVVVHGVVVDEDGKPVAGASISGVSVWEMRNSAGSASSGGPISPRTTDERGAFTVELPGAKSNLTLHLSARHGNAFTARALELHGDDLEKPLKLTISPRNARALRVRVVDDEGKPISGAAVVVRHRPSGPPLYAQPGNKPVDLPKDAGPTTDRAGRWKTPACLAPDGSYQIELSADGFFADKTPWKEITTEPEAIFTATLRQLRLMQGQILDRQGKPVAGARVQRSDERQKVETVTDKDGHFQLKSAFFTPGFLFVSKSGFRFHGQRCDGPKGMKIALIRRDESQPRKMTTLPPVLSRAERKELAARLMEPILRNIRKSDDGTRARPLQALGRLDPGRLLAELDSRPMQDAWYDAYVRRTAVQALTDDAPDEARSIIESMKNPYFRCTGYLDLCDGLPAAKKAEKRALLHQALLHARGIQASDRRILQLAAVARRLAALGDKELATKLLREGQQIARELPNAGWSAYARSAFAEDLALIDLESALALMKDLKDRREFVRHHGNLAFKLAGTDPAAAERVFGILLKENDIQSAYQRDQHAQQICQRMASVDCARAQKIADAIRNIDYKARSYGLIAQSLARSQPDEALALLDRAFELLEKEVASGKGGFDNFTDAASLAGLMLPVAEEIDAALVPEFFWRVLSLHSPPNIRVEDEWHLSRQTDALGALALALVRYDRDLALVFVGEARKCTQSMRHNSFTYVLAAALADPHRAVALIETLPEVRKDYWREEIVNLLLAEGDAVWKLVHRAMAQWYAGDEENL